MIYYRIKRLDPTDETYLTTGFIFKHYPNILNSLFIPLNIVLIGNIYIASYCKQINPELK